MYGMRVFKMNLKISFKFNLSSHIKNGVTIIRLLAFLAHVIDVHRWRLGKPCSSTFRYSHKYNLLLSFGNYAPTAAVRCQEEKNFVFLLLSFLWNTTGCSSPHNTPSVVPNMRAGTPNGVARYIWGVGKKKTTTAKKKSNFCKEILNRFTWYELWYYWT